MSKAKIIISILLLVACGIALLLLPRRPAGVERSPALAGRIVLYGYTKDGKLSWEMTAEEGKIDKETQDLSNVTICFPQENGTDLVISAASLVQQDGLRRLGGVRIEGRDDLKMTTESLDWNDDAATLSADRVKLTYGGIEVSGEGYRYDINEGSSSLSSGVEGTIEREEVISVRGDRAEESGGRIVIAGDVVVQSDDKTYRSDRLESDSEGNEVILAGGVSAVMSEGKLIGETLRIDRNGISVSGSVVLDFHLTGDNGA